MSEKAHFTAEEARAAGERVGIDWALSRFDVEQFRMGMDVELAYRQCRRRGPNPRPSDQEMPFAGVPR